MLPIPGADEVAIGMKHVEEAVAIRDRLLTAFDRASVLEPGPERSRLLTFAFVGGGFSGVEGFGELLSLATALLKRYPEIRFSELSFHLVEANDRILPEVTEAPGRWVVDSLRARGGRVHLNARVVSAVDGHVVLSDGESFDANLIVWTAGNGAHPVIAKHTDLPTDERGRLVVRADLRIGTPDAPVPDAWAAGDAAAVPDLASPVPGGTHRAERAARGASGQAPRERTSRRPCTAAERETTATTRSASWPRSGWAAASSSTSGWSSRVRSPG